MTNAGGGNEIDPSTYDRRRRLTSLYSAYGPEAAAIVEARNMASKKKPAGGATNPGATPTSNEKGPTSLFLLSEENFIRRHTRFIIEWPYPFPQNANYLFEYQQDTLQVGWVNYFALSLSFTLTYLNLLFLVATVCFA